MKKIIMVIVLILLISFESFAADYQSTISNAEMDFIGDNYCANLAEVTAALAGSATHLVIRGTITLTGALDLTKPVTVMKGGSFVTGAYTLTISNHLEAGPYEIFDTTSDVGVEFTNYQDVRLIWFDTSAAASAAILNGTTMWVDGTIDLDVKGRLDFNNVVHLKGNGWGRVGSSSVSGSILTYTGDGAAVEFNPPSWLQGATIRDLTITHSDDDNAAIHLEKMVRTRVSNVFIDGGFQGISYGADAYFSLVENSVIANYTNIGIHIPSTANGSEYEFVNNHVSTTQVGAVAALKTERLGTRIIGGEYVCNATGGIGIWFHNAEASVAFHPFIESTPTAILIDGTGATSEIYIYSPRTGGTTDSVFKFGDYSRDNIIYNPQVLSITSGNLAEWGAASTRCGIYGDPVSLASSISVDVHASATSPFIRLVTPAPDMSSIISNVYLRVYNTGGTGWETANAEEPTDGKWEIGDIVHFIDSGDASGDGLYFKAASSTWSQLN